MCRDEDTESGEHHHPRHANLDAPLYPLLWVMWKGIVTIATTTIVVVIVTVICYCYCYCYGLVIIWDLSS
jgi:hypothetical protein